MEIGKLNDNIEKSHIYQFLVEHKKFINIIQGFFVIGLLIGINIYVVQDHFIKKQIAENCGYTTSKYSCICEQHYVDDWKALQNGDLSINLSKYENVTLVS